MHSWILLGLGAKASIQAEKYFSVELLQVLQPLVDLPLGILMRLLHTPAVPADVQLAALATLRHVYACRGCPFVASEDLADRYIQIHYVMFLKLYLLPQQPSGDCPDPPSSARSLSSSVRSTSSADDNGSSRRARCLAHLHVLIALAGHKHKHVQLLFQRHKVLQFLAAELSLEFHAKRHGSLSRLRTSTAPACANPTRSGPAAAHRANAIAHRGSRAVVASQPRAAVGRTARSAAFKRSTSGAQVAEAGARNTNQHSLPAEDGFLSPLSSVESRHCCSHSRAASTVASKHSRQSRMSTPTARSYDRPSARPPLLQQLSGASGARTSLTTVQHTWQRGRPPAIYNRVPVAFLHHFFGRANLCRAIRQQ